MLQCSGRGTTPLRYEFLRWRTCGPSVRACRPVSPRQCISDATREADGRLDSQLLFNESRTEPNKSLGCTVMTPGKDPHRPCSLNCFQGRHSGETRGPEQELGAQSPCRGARSSAAHGEHGQGVAAGAPQGTGGIGRAGLATFPDREPQVLAPATQHRVSPAATAAGLPGVGSRAQGGGPTSPPGLALQGAGQVDRGREPPTRVSALPLPQELREQRPRAYCTGGETGPPRETCELGKPASPTDVLSS